MKINTLQLENFRCFKNIELTPNGRSMIIFGKNGTGKSSILRAIRYVLSYLENALYKGKNIKKNKVSISKDDIYNGESDLRITSIFNPQNFVFAITYPKERATNYYNLHDFEVLKSDYKEYLENEVFIYYGIDRYVYSNYIDSNANSKNIGKIIDKSGLKCLVDYSSFVYWYRETQENYYKFLKENISSIESGNNARNYFAVQEIIAKILDGCEEMSYNIEEGNIDLIFKFADGRTLKYWQLSDGEKTMVSLFTDILMRLYENNKYTNSPINTGGIVIIDEIEQHLHLSWQRTILKKLKETFPNIQFIITTHSPIVLSESGNDYYLVGLKNCDNLIVKEEISAVGGYDIAYIISKFLETDTDSEIVNSIKKKFDECLKNKNLEGAKDVLLEWEKISGSDNVDIEFAKYDLEMLNK